MREGVAVEAAEVPLEGVVRGEEEEAVEEEVVTEVAAIVVWEFISPPPVATCRILAKVERRRLLL